MHKTLILAMLALACAVPAMAATCPDGPTLLRVDTIIRRSLTASVTFSSDFPLDGQRVTCVAKDDAGRNLETATNYGQGSGLADTIIFMLPEEYIPRVASAECWVRPSE